ncbi:MAG: Ldh family oxidoreductase [Roseburia sp.]|nr:Ldh family oxidoreductase [Roseburia sp.]
MPRVSLEKIDHITKYVLLKCGVDKDSIEIIQQTIRFANRRGVATHGVGRLPLYVKKIQSGTLNPVNCMEQVSSSGAVAVYDAHNGFGQVAAEWAMKDCLERAGTTGIAAVGVRNSHNFGMAGYFGEMAARQGMAAIIFANAAPAIAPTGGAKPLLGTNPLCYAFPGSDTQPPVILDMATSVAARGKIRLAAKNGEKIPLDWAMDKNGKPTEDPNEALAGSLFPIGGYKGYGLALFVDMFAGLLTGSAYAGGVQPLSKTEVPSRNGHLFITLDVKKFVDEAEYRTRLDILRREILSCGAPGNVLFPGERGYRETDKNTETVELPLKQIQEINKLADTLSVPEHLEIVT